MASIRKYKTRDEKTKFYVQIRLKGYPAQTACFDRKTDAEKWIQDTESAIRHNRYFKTSESRKHTFEELADRYIKSVLPTKKTAKDQKLQLEWWKKQIGEKVLADISPSLISEYKDKLLTEKTNKGKKRSPSTVVRYLAVLSHLFTIAAKEWGWITDNPVRLITKPKEAKGRVRFLDEKEREAI